MKKVIAATLLTLTSSGAFAQKSLNHLNLFCQDGSFRDSTFNLKISGIKVNRVQRDYFQYISDSCRVSFGADGQQVYNCGELTDVQYITSANIKKQKVEYVSQGLSTRYATFQVTGGEVVSKLESISSSNPSRIAPKYSGFIEFNPNSARCDRDNADLCNSTRFGLKEFKPIRLTFDGKTKKAVLELENGQRDITCTVSDNLR
jgi:hypothetical protein